jgi:hypothetical protein
MERLTQFNQDYYEIKDDKGNLIAPKYSKLDQVITKLGKLENIEEELNLPLDFIFRALKNGIWTYEYWDCEKPENKDKLKLIHPSLYFESSLNQFVFDCGDNGYYSVSLKDYKKSWWLKEDRSE